MGEIIGFVNNKGGCGKTIAVTTIAEILALSGKQVLIVDTDPQANSTQVYGAEDQGRYDISDVFLNENLTANILKEFIIQTSYDNISIIPSSRQNHKDTERKILLSNSGPSSFLILKNALIQLQGFYNYILIDSGPSLNTITSNVILASDSIILPVFSDGFSFEGLNNLVNECLTLANDMGSPLKIKGILMQNVKKRTILFRSVFDQYIEIFGDLFIPTVIRQDQKVIDAITRNTPLLHDAGRCNAASDYIDATVALELISKQDGKLLKKKYGTKI